MAFLLADSGNHTLVDAAARATVTVFHQSRGDIEAHGLPRHLQSFETMLDRHDLYNLRGKSGVEELVPICCALALSRQVSSASCNASGRILATLGCDVYFRNMIREHMDVVAWCATGETTPERLRLMNSLTHRVDDLHLPESLPADIASLVGTLTNTLVQPEEKSPELITASLEAIANLSRSSKAVVRHIRGTTNANALYKSLAQSLDAVNMESVACALSIYTSHILHDATGIKIFSDSHVLEIFQLIVNMVGELGQYMFGVAVDALTEMLTVSRIVTVLQKSQQLEGWIDDLLQLAFSDRPSTCVSALELLRACATAPALAQPIADAVSTNERMPQMAALLSRTNPTADAAVMSGRLLLMLYKNAANLPPLGPVIQAVVNVLQRDGTALPVEGFDTTLERDLTFIDLANVMAEEKYTRVKVAKTIDAAGLAARIAAEARRGRGVVCAGLIGFMKRFMNELPAVKACLQQAMTDPVVSASVARDLASSTDAETTLSLLNALRLGLTGCPADQRSNVAEVVTASNARRARVVAALQRRVTQQAVPTPTDYSAPPNVSPIRATAGQEVASFEVHKIDQSRVLREVHFNSKQSSTVTVTTSAGVDSRDATLARLHTHVLQLQDLVEAKGMAITQADSIANDHRLRRTQVEAENAQLRDQIANLTSRLRDLELLTEEVAGLREESAQLVVTRENLSSCQVAMAVTETRLSEVQSQLDRSRDEQAARLRELQTAEQHRHTLTEQLATAKSEAGKLSTDLSAKQSHVESLNAELAAARLAASKQDHEIRDAQRTIGDHETLIGRLKERLVSAKNDVAALQERERDATQQINQLNGTLQELRTHNASLSETMTRHEAETRRLSGLLALVHALSGQDGDRLAARLGSFVEVTATSHNAHTINTASVSR